MTKDITEKGKFQSTLLASRVLWNPWYKTMIIVADYELEYKEELGVFGKALVRPPDLPLLRRSAPLSGLPQKDPSAWRWKKGTHPNPPAFL